MSHLSSSLALKVWRGCGENLSLGIIIQGWRLWKKARDHSWGKCSLSWYGDPRTFKIPVPSVIAFKRASSVGWRLAWAHETSYLFCRGQRQRSALFAKAPLSLENSKWVPDIKHFYTVEVWLYFHLGASISSPFEQKVFNHLREFLVYFL